MYQEQGGKSARGCQDENYNSQISSQIKWFVTERHKNRVFHQLGAKSKKWKQTLIHRMKLNIEKQTQNTHLSQWNNLVGQTILHLHKLIYVMILSVCVF